MLSCLSQCPSKMPFLWKDLETLSDVLDQTVTAFSELCLVPRQILEPDFYLHSTRLANSWVRFLCPSRRLSWGRAGSQMHWRASSPAFAGLRGGAGLALRVAWPLLSFLVCSQILALGPHVLDVSVCEQFSLLTSPLLAYQFLSLLIPIYFYWGKLYIT